MSDTPDRAGDGWFTDLEPGDLDAARVAIMEGTADSPGNWPELAVNRGFVDSVDAYYERLHEAATYATRETVREREQADDQQVKHGIRAMDDLDRISNELAERVTEWAGSRDASIEGGVDGIAAATQLSTDSGLDRRLVSLATAVETLRAERSDLEASIEQTMPTIAPNLSALAGPLLGARLIALAGSLERLAKLPSGTVQVLGAEDALFAHLHGQASSPKHGVIYTHEYVRGTAPAHRGSAARALAGKLSIAARIDHYSGDYRPDLERQLNERIARIQERTA